MAANQLYEDELTYLRDLGTEFARANPKLAGFLGPQSNDPDVERLLEGFAFIAARLRQRLDDELPELVHGLMRLVWPHYLRPIPPMTMIGFEGTAASTQTPVILPEGTVLRSRALDGVSCPFVTTRAVEVLPLSISKVQLDNRGTSARLTFQLDCVGRSSLQCLVRGRLRLFFNGERDASSGHTLLLGLLRHVSRMEASTETGRKLVLRQDAIRPVGFEANDALLPWPSNSFPGFRLIQEYLTFPQKFLSADLTGLEPLADEAARTLRIAIEFARPFPDSFRAGDSLLKLNCAPAINLFLHDGQPLRTDRNKTEYRVLPNQPATHSIHAISEITGYVQGRPERHVYQPFESFRHDLPGDEQAGYFFRERLRPSVVGRGVDTYVSFVDRLSAISHPETEVMSIRLRCSNGPLAERLGVGSIDQPTADFPNTVAFSNLTPVSAEIPPPISDGLLWRLLSNLARNYGSLVDVEALRTIIAAYDFRAVQDVQARRRLELMLSALERFETRAGDAVIRGMPVRMRFIRLFAKETQLGGEADMFLLGAVLDAFLASYTSVNNLHQFAIEGIETKAAYQWTPRSGSSPSI